MSAPTPNDLPNWERWEPGSFTQPGASPHVARLKASAAAAGGSPDALSLQHLREAARDEGYRTGYDKGHAEGLDAGREEALAAGRVQAELLAQAIVRFDEGAARLEKDVAQELLNLALGIARRIVGETLEAQPEAVMASIREALAQIPAQHAIIHLNREDAELIRVQAGDSLARAGHRIHENASLARGDVLVEAGGTQIDARLETRWQRVWESLEPEPVVHRTPT